jgi:signal transduction histidine kinase
MNIRRGDSYADASDGSGAGQCGLIMWRQHKTPPTADEIADAAPADERAAVQVDVPVGTQEGASDHALRHSRLERRLLARARSMNLAAQFMAAASVSVLLLMLLLGYWVNNRLEASVLTSAGNFGGLYLQNFLTPYVQTINRDGTLPPEMHSSLDRVLNSPRFAQHVVTVKIWNRDKEIVYSDDKQYIGLRSTIGDLDRAFAGEIVTRFEEHEHDDGDSHPDVDMPLIEIYAPLRSTDTGEIVAVGEFYERGIELRNDIRRLEIATWLIVAGVTVPMILILYLIVRRGSNVIDTQERQLRTKLAEARHLANQNARLRRSADLARVEATRTTETLLGRIGSDLHDGPIQLLSLLMLKLGARTGSFSGQSVARDTLIASDRELASIADDIMQELRTVSTGLSLPELQHLPLADVLRLAIERHENLTGTHVGAVLGELPANVSHPLKICLYRIVQEGLQNATKHAAGLGQRVEAHCDGAAIRLEISDQGPGIASADPAQPPVRTKETQHLGLKGIRSRITAFGGQLSVHSDRQSGTRIVVLVPVAE